MTSARALVAVLLLAVVVLPACSDPEKAKVRHVQKGDQYVTERKDEFAVVEYAQAIQIDPKYGDAHWKLAQTYERLGNAPYAFAEYVRAADALPDKRDVQVKATQLLLVARRFEDAKARSAALLLKDPENVEAHLLHASALAALNEPDGALAEIEEALKQDPRNSGVFLALAGVRAQKGQLEEAEAAFRKAIEVDPASAGVQLAFANFLFKEGRVGDGEAALKQVLSTEPQNVVANQMLASLYLSTKRVSEAEQPLKLLAGASKDPGPKFQLVDYYVSASRSEEATQLLTTLSQDPRTFAEAERKLAALEYSQKRTDDAHKRLDTLLVKAPTYAPAIAMKAQWLATEGKLDQAFERAKAAVAADPQSASAFGILAEIQERRGETADAIKSYTEVLRLNPLEARAQTALSRLNLARGKQDAAVQFAQEAARLTPARLSARVALAQSLLTSGDLTGAQNEIRTLVEGAPNLAISHTLQGLLLAQKNDTTGARRSFERALELSPGSIEAIRGLTVLDLQAKAPARAIARLEGELAKRPNDTTLLGMSAQAYFAAGDAAKAEQVLRRAVTVDPRFSTGYLMLARLYMQEKRLDDARTEFEGITKRDPSNIGARTMVGMLLETQGRSEDARKWYEGIVSGTDDAPVAANNLAYIYAERKQNLDIALQLATSAKPKLPDDPNVDDTIGWVYYQKDLASLAVGPLEASLQKRPNNPEVLSHLGLTYAKLGDKTKAREALTRARTLDSKAGGSEVDRALASLAP